MPNSRCAVIVPQSSMTGKTNEEQQIKESILKNHTLEGVIMLQKDTFYGIGVIPCIAVFTSGQPHPKDKICKFINFEDDGFKVSPHVGLLETEAAKDKKQHLPTKEKRSHSDCVIFSSPPKCRSHILTPSVC